MTKIKLIKIQIKSKIKDIIRVLIVEPQYIDKK
jgi:hypothetical protein